MTVQSEPTGSSRSLPGVAWIATAIAIGSIWLAILVAGTYAPDFVSGSQHEHLGLVAAGDWIWGLVATAFVVLAVLDGFRRHAMSWTPWLGLAIGTAITWAVVAFVSVTAPVFVTGTDPTTIPLAAMGIPIVGVFVTWFVCALTKTAFEEE
jgi:hypothetical protein